MLIHGWQRACWYDRTRKHLAYVDRANNGHAQTCAHELKYSLAMLFHYSKKREDRKQPNCYHQQELINRLCYSQTMDYRAMKMNGLPLRVNMDKSLNNNTE